ncbi:MAG: hypothetical protein IJ530_11920 [Treponema sp.]|nr:hypothetical protein [Treponema sp.]
MKTWQKYLFIYIPIGFFCCFINFCAKKDNRAPYVEYHLLHELDKTEYSVNDLVTGKNLGKINFSIDNDEVIFDISAEAVSGTLMIGEYGDLYQYSNIDLTTIKVQKQKCKILDFYSGKVGDWNTVVIMSLDNNDLCEYYKSSNKRRYLFYLLKNGDYNFSIKDTSVYDAYSSFGASIKEMRYAAILE